jgi:hypothetical protein
MRLILLLPFYLIAMAFAIVAGVIGGRKWRVRIELKQHEEGQSIAEINAKVILKQ